MSNIDSGVIADTTPKRKFKSVRKVLKSKGARGIDDAEKILDGIIEEWDGLHEELEAMPEDDQENMKDHFNELIPGQDQLGTILFGDCDEF